MFIPAFQTLETKINTDLKPTEKRDDPLKTLIKHQKHQIIALKTQIDSMKRELKLLDTSRGEASFKFELTGLSKFFELEGNERYSTLFWCANLQWSLYAKVSTHFDLSKYLALFLYRHTDEPIRWPFKLDYKFILFNHLAEQRNRFSEYSGTFEKFTKKRIYGLLRLISYTEIIDPSNGFILDDKVVLGVEMKAEPVARDSILKVL